MTISEHLQASAAIVRQGWMQWSRHEHVKGTGAVCAIGALERVINTPWQAEGTCPAVIEALAGVLPDANTGEAVYQSAVGRIVWWNNAEDQTAENVALTMEFAALVWEQQQIAAIAEPTAEVTRC